MSPELPAQVAKIAKEDLLTLRDPQYGWLAGLPRYLTPYSRDIAKGSKFVFSCPPHLIPDWFIKSTERAVWWMVKYQGTQFDPDRDEEEGRIFHELHNGYIPPSGFQIEEPKLRRYNGVSPYYGADDATSLFIELVADLARVKEILSKGEGERYVKKLWPSVVRANKYQTRVADSSGYGLIDSIPKNPFGLFFQTEHDSDFSYRTEEGETPRPPHFFLEDNCHFVESQSKMAWMGQLIGDAEIVADATKRYQNGRKTIHEMFYMKDEGYYSPLFDGEGNKVRIFTDDAVEGLWLHTFEDRFGRQAIDQLKDPTMNTEWGLRSRSYLSRQFAMNGPKAYWNGNVWPQDTAKAAFGCENYGCEDFAQELDQELFAFILTRRSEETAPVDDNGQLLRYQEKGRSAACTPQFWAASAALARALVRSIHYTSQAA